MKDKIFGVLQRVGRSFMLPIALLPVAGLLLGIGSSFTNETMLAAYGLNSVIHPGTLIYTILDVMSQTGSAVFNNLALLFAMGVAIGMARKEKEVAALSGAVAYIIMNTAIQAMINAAGGVEAMPANSTTTMLGITTLQMGVFGGIVVGLGVAALHNKFYKIELPQVLAFFGGTRFVPIVSSIVYLVVGIAMFYIWPVVQSGIAALGALESSLLPEEKLQFSVDHMTMNNGFTLTQDDGGEYTMGMAYLAAWKGPVYEKDDPYGDNQTNEDLTAVKHVQEMQIIESKDYEKIKEAVFKYGGVQTSIYNALRSSQSSSPYYNKSTDAYCYIGTEKPNHDVVIVGWDDSYSKDNFNTDLEGDGAFICQNSWGDNFGENGFFYSSYYDTNIGTHNVVYTDIENTDNYDHIYQSDLCGWVGQLGYNKDSIYGANVFTAEGNETLKAASFYATGKDSQYELYVVRQFEDETSLEKMIPVASGKLGNAGYYTVDFNQGIEVYAGERYAVVLYIITPGSVHPMAIEYAADEATENVDLDDGESYISANGSKWVSVDTVEKSNLCIKAFSDNR